MCDLKMFMFRSNYELHKTRGSNIFVRHSGVLKAQFKGIIRSFELKEICLFYYFIDAGEFFYSNDIH